MKKKSRHRDEGRKIYANLFVKFSVSATRLKCFFEIRLFFVLTSPSPFWRRRRRNTTNLYNEPVGPWVTNAALTIALKNLKADITRPPRVSYLSDLSEKSSDHKVLPQRLLFDKSFVLGEIAENSSVIIESNWRTGPWAWDFFVGLIRMGNLHCEKLIIYVSYVYVCVCTYACMYIYIYKERKEFQVR